jgi:hypothetical protein
MEPFLTFLPHYDFLTEEKLKITQWEDSLGDNISSQQLTNYVIDLM